MWDCPEVVEGMTSSDMQNRIVRILKEFEKRVTIVIISRRNVLQEIQLKCKYSFEFPQLTPQEAASIVKYMAPMDGTLEESQGEH